MPDDQDRVLAQFAVEAGFLTREQASGYWQRLHTPGSPRLISLLMQEGRISQPQIEQLRLRYMSMQQLQNAVVASSPTVIDGEIGDSPASASETALQPTVPDSWEEAMQKDALLARALLDQDLTSLERLRECRQLQIKHRIRLGVVLVKLGYAERSVVEIAIRSVVDQLAGAPASSADHYQAAQTQLDGLAGPPRNLDEMGTVLDGPLGPGAQAATMLNDPHAAPLAPPGHDPFDSVSTGRSTEELNPFLRRGAPQFGGGDSDLDIPMPGQTKRRPIPSVDELDAFADVPLPPPPSPGAHELPGSPAPTREEEPTMPFRSSGFTPTGVPIGGEIETGSTRLKAREKASLKRKKAHKRAKRTSSNFSLLVILMLAGGLAIAGGLYAIIAYMDM